MHPPSKLVDEEEMQGRENGGIGHVKGGWRAFKWLHRS